MSIYLPYRFIADALVPDESFPGYQSWLQPFESVCRWCCRFPLGWRERLRCYESKLQSFVADLLADVTCRFLSRFTHLLTRISRICRAIQTRRWLLPRVAVIVSYRWGGQELADL